MKKLTLLLMMSIAAGTAVAQNLSVCVGKGYTLNSKAGADATGTSPVSYQWYEDSNLLTGENASSLTIPAGKAVGTYAYVRMASNEECPAGVASNTFTVRVVPIPSVPSLPSQNGPKCAGTGITFSATKPDDATGLDWTGSVSGQGTSKTTATTAGNYSAQVRSYLTSGEATCYSGWTSPVTGTINGPAGRDQAAGACGCASNLTACNGTCRDLAADEAVCWNNREIKQYCVADDWANGCTEWGGLSRVAFSRADTQVVLKLIWSAHGIGHIIWTSETNGSTCRWACDTNYNNPVCQCYTPGSVQLGWFASR
jgi:hypothetical protein